MRMRFAVGWSRYGVQHPHGSRPALPFLRPRLEGPSGRDDCDHCSANLPDPSAVDVARSRTGRLGDVSPRRRARRSGPRVVGRVLEPLDLADPQALPPYWDFLWSLNPPTYCSLQSSSGSPLKSSTAAEEAGAAAVYPFFQTKHSVISTCAMWGRLSAGSRPLGGSVFPFCRRKNHLEGCWLICRFCNRYKECAITYDAVFSTNNCVLLGQDGILRRPRRPIANRPQPDNLPHKATNTTRPSRDRRKRHSTSKPRLHPPPRNGVITPGVSQGIRLTSIKPNPDRKGGDSLA